jgi:hypothetical protein
METSREHRFCTLHRFKCLSEKSRDEDRNLGGTAENSVPFWDGVFLCILFIMSMTKECNRIILIFDFSERKEEC